MTKLKDKKKFLLWIMFALVFVLHFLIVQNKFLTFSEVFDGKMIMNFDYGLHYYDVEKGVDFISSSHSMHGFDTAFFGGFEKGIMDDLSAKAWIIFAWLFSFLGVASAYKLFVYLTLMGMPLILAGALKVWGTKREVILLGLVLAILYQNTLKMGNFLWVGMITFPLAVYLSLLCAGLFKKLLENTGKVTGTETRILPYWIHFTALASLTFYVHVLAFILVGLPCLVLYIMNFSRLNAKNHLMIFGSAVAVAILNLPWLWPLLNSGVHITNQMSEQFFQSPGLNQALVDVFYLYVPSSFHSFNLRILLLLGAIVSMFFIFKKDRKTAWFLTANILIFGLITYLPASALNAIQPYRFQIALDLWLLISILISLNFAFSKNKNLRKTSYILTGLLALVLILSFCTQAFKTLLVNERILNSEPNSALEATIDYFIQNKTDGRILFEVEHSADAVFFQAKTGNDLIGGPYRYAFWGNVEAHFTEDKIFNMDIKQVDEQKWNEMIEKYSITYAVCYSQKSCLSLDQSHIWHLEQDYGARKIYSN